MARLVEIEGPGNVEPAGPVMTHRHFDGSCMEGVSASGGGRMLVTEVLRSGDSASGVDPSDRAEIELSIASWVAGLARGLPRFSSRAMAAGVSATGLSSWFGVWDAAQPDA